MVTEKKVFSFERNIPPSKVKTSFFHTEDNPLLSIVKFTWYPDENEVISVASGKDRDDHMLFGAVSIKLTGAMYWLKEKSKPILIVSGVKVPEFVRDKVAEFAFKQLSPDLQKSYR